MGTAASPLNLLCCYFLLLALPPSIPFHSTESLQPQYLTHSFLSLSLTPYLIKSTDATDRTACLIYSAYLNPDRPCLPYLNASRNERHHVSGPTHQRRDAVKQVPLPRHQLSHGQRRHRDLQAASRRQEVA